MVVCGAGIGMWRRIRGIYATVRQMFWGEIQSVPNRSNSFNAVATGETNSGAKPRMHV